MEQMKRYFHSLITTSKLNRQEYDFDYDDDDDADMDDAGGDIENQYYKAKCTSPISWYIPYVGYSWRSALKDDDAQAALKAFRAVVNDQPEKGEW